MKPHGDPFAEHRKVSCPEITTELDRWIATVRPTPGVFVHGVMVRSGTQFVTNLMALHPDLERHPRDIWELPLLGQSKRLDELAEGFFDRYRFNRDRLRNGDLCALLGTAFAAYVQAAAPGKRILMTQPSAEYLDHFFAYFPHEHLLLLMRDGRDVVTSVVKTWPDWPFDDAARHWADNARMMLRTRDLLEAEGRPFHYGTYEEAAGDAAAFARAACEGLALDPDAFPYDKIESHVLVKGSSQFEGSNEERWKADAKPKTFNPVGRWHGWTDEQKQSFKDIGGQALIDCGYETSLDW